MFNLNRCRFPGLVAGLEGETKDRAVVESNDSYTKYPNEILEAQALTLFSPKQQRIFSVIMRQTYGFHREWWTPDNKKVELEKKTGLSVTHCYKAIRELEQRNIVTGNGHGWKINPLTTQWREVTGNRQGDRKPSRNSDGKWSQISDRNPSSQQGLKPLKDKPSQAPKEKKESIKERGKPDQDKPKKKIDCKKCGMPFMPAKAYHELCDYCYKPKKQELSHNYPECQNPKCEAENTSVIDGFCWKCRAEQEQAAH